MFKVPHDQPARLDRWLKANNLDPDMVDYGEYIYTSEGMIYLRIWEPEGHVKYPGKCVQSFHHVAPLVTRWE